MEPKTTEIHQPPPPYEAHVQPATENAVGIQIENSDKEAEEILQRNLGVIRNEEEIFLNEVLTEALYGFRLEKGKSYRFTKADDSLLFSASEENANFWNKILFQQNRSFRMEVKGADNNVSMIFQRFMSNDTKLFGHNLQIKNVQGVPFACVHQTTIATFRTPDFKITDNNGKDQLLIKGPVHPYVSFAETLYEIISVADSVTVGSIKRIYSGSSTQVSTYVSVTRKGRKIQVSFNRDLDVKLKAAIMGAAVLIDFMVFD